MAASSIIFYLLAAFTLVFAVMAVSTRQIFRAAIYLLFSLIGVAGIYFWLQYDFIAAVQIVVYVGGITVLIIFSIFLTQQVGELLPIQKVTNKLLAAGAAFFSFALIMVQLYKHSFAKTTAQPVSPAIDNIGSVLLSTEAGGYALPFELVSILLLAALVGCIVIAMRPANLSTTQPDN
ncbi:MAG: hypothetical protein RL172_2501 [Bacteroidota bacterium]